MPRQAPTKIGDVFEVITEEGKGHLLQLVAIDAVNLNSDAIAVFPKLSQGQAYADAVAVEPLFYTHTTASEGVRRQLWQKLANVPVQLNIGNLMFKNYHGEDEKEALEAVGDPSLMPPVPFPNWTVWTPLDTEWKYIPLDEGMQLIAEDGGITPPEDIVYRIVNGESEFKKNWPQ